MGVDAWDYDILNAYDKTDYQIDLFAEIRKGYIGEASIFDGMGENDLIFAFFPCIRFENQIMLAFRGQSHGMEKWTYKDKMLHDMQLLEEVKENYDLVNMLFIICMDRGIKLIMENPFSEEHFLRRYWCYPAAIIDKDRRENGDYFKKPTQYWFLNCDPKNNLVWECIDWVAVESTGDGKDSWARRTGKDLEKCGAKTIKQARSMIHPQYASRFIRQYVI